MSNFLRWLCAILIATALLLPKHNDSIAVVKNGASVKNKKEIEPATIKSMKQELMLKVIKKEVKNKVKHMTRTLKRRIVYGS